MSESAATPLTECTSGDPLTLVGLPGLAAALYLVLITVVSLIAVFTKKPARRMAA